MSCLTDINPLGFLGGDVLLFCDLTVEADVPGAPVRVRFTAQAGEKNLAGVSDKFTGVLTEIAADGTPYVVDLFNTVQVSVQSGTAGAINPIVPFTLQSLRALAPDLAGRQLHVAIGPANLFKYSTGEPFQANPTAMMRTSFTVPRAPAVSAFSLSVGRISRSVSPTTAPTATVDVSNLGTGSGIDAVTGVTTDTQGTVVGKWSAADSPLIPAGGTQPVSLSMVAAPGSQYAGQTLTVTFTDSHGNRAQATFTVTSPTPAQGGTGQQPTQQPGTSPSPTPATTSPSWPLIIGLGAAAAGAIAIVAASQE